MSSENLDPGARYSVTVNRPRGKTVTYEATFVRAEGEWLRFELDGGVLLRVERAVLAEEPTAL